MQDDSKQVNPGYQALEKGGSNVLHMLRQGKHAAASVCTFCGSALGASSAFVSAPLGIARQPDDHPATSFNPYAPPGSGPSLAQGPLPIASSPRPWVRYWARTIDLGMALLLAGVVLTIFEPDFLEGSTRERMFALAIVFAWVFVESILLATIGTTPGKWLLNTKVMPASGLGMDLSSAFSRSIKVWWRGFGMGLPVVGLFTLIAAHRNLSSNGITSWDKEGGFVIVHGALGLARTLVAIILIAGSTAFAFFQR